MTDTTISKLSRALRYRVRKQGTVTIDDAAELLHKQTGKSPSVSLIRKVLRKPTYRPVGYKKTSKQSRHGRPVRSWALAAK